MFSPLSSRTYNAEAVAEDETAPVETTAEGRKRAEEGGFRTLVLLWNYNIEARAGGWRNAAIMATNADGQVPSRGNWSASNSWQITTMAHLFQMGK